MNWALCQVPWRQGHACSYPAPCSLVFPCLCASSLTRMADFPPLWPPFMSSIFFFLLRAFGLTFGKYFLSLSLLSGHPLILGV